MNTYSRYTCSQCNHEGSEPCPEHLTDGLGNSWSKLCPRCREHSMEIVRPGRVQCGNCEDAMAFIVESQHTAPDSYRSVCTIGPEYVEAHLTFLEKRGYRFSVTPVFHS